MKRRPELRDLSEQHHHGLVAARRLRQAAAGERPLAEAVAAFLAAWRDEIAPHFRREEEVLLPEFSRVAGHQHPLVTRTLGEHVALRRAARELARAAAAGQQVLAGEIGRGLDDHIRFEERVLFPAIEAALEGTLLARLGAELKEDGDGTDSTE